MGSSNKKGTLLFVTPTRPALSGHGTSMRAAGILTALSVEYDISLLIVDLYRKRQFNCDIGGATQWCSDVYVLDPASTPSSLPCTLKQFDVIFVLRIACIRFAEPYLELAQPGCVRILDMDDYESRTHIQFARLAVLRGEHEQAMREVQIASYCSKLEDSAVGMFDFVALSNDEDRASLNHHYSNGKFIWIPNLIRPSIEHPSKNKNKRIFTLLFVGTMDYFPNVDGVQYFCAQILPLIRKKIAPAECQVLIVGCRPLESVKELTRCKQVTVTGEVENLAGYYEMADLAVVPLRAGGGTRIKILEAFEHKVPIVSTSIGCEGLGVDDGTHLEIADTPEAFATRCAHLLFTPELRKRLASAAFQWVQAEHSLERVKNFPLCNLTMHKPHTDL